MKIPLVLVAAVGLAACAESPVTQQAAFETRFDPVRADTSILKGYNNFAPSRPMLMGAGRYDVPAGRAIMHRFAVVLVHRLAGSPRWRRRKAKVPTP